MRRDVYAWVTAAIVAGGCGERSDSEGIVPAAAFERPDKDEAVAKLEAAKRKADARAEEAAVAREAELDALAEAVTVLPTKMPKSIKVACAEVSDALDSIVRRQFANDPAGLAEWESSREAMLTERRTECESLGELDVAACEANALRNADARLLGDAFGLIERCQKKFADELAQRPPKP